MRVPCSRPIRYMGLPLYPILNPTGLLTANIMVLFFNAHRRRVPCWANVPVQDPDVWVSKAVLID